MFRKVLRSNKLCLVLTGLLWLITLIVRFALLSEQIPPADWIFWVACNNLMIAGFAYQWGLITASARATEKRNRFLLRRKAATVRKPDTCV